jgi:hypothetical protein
MNTDTSNQKSELIRRKIRKDFFAGMQHGNKLQRHERDFLSIASDCFNELDVDICQPSKVLLELKRKLWEVVEPDTCVMQRMYIYYATSLYHAIAAFLSYYGLICSIGSPARRIETHIVAHAGNCSSRVVMTLEMLCQIDFVMICGCSEYKSILEAMWSKDKAGDKDKTPVLPVFEANYYDSIFADFGADFTNGNGKVYFRDKVVHRAFPYIINRRRNLPIGWFLLKPNICDDQLTLLRSMVDKEKKGWEIQEVIPYLFNIKGEPISVEVICWKLCTLYLKTLIRVSRNCAVPKAEARK